MLKPSCLPRLKTETLPTLLILLHEKPLLECQRILTTTTNWLLNLNNTFQITFQIPKLIINAIAINIK